MYLNITPGCHNNWKHHILEDSDCLLPGGTLPSSICVTSCPDGDLKLFQVTLALSAAKLDDDATDTTGADAQTQKDTKKR